MVVRDGEVEVISPEQLVQRIAPLAQVTDRPRCPNLGGILYKLQLASAQDPPGWQYCLARENIQTFAHITVIEAPVLRVIQAHVKSEKMEVRGVEPLS